MKMWHQIIVTLLIVSLCNADQEQEYFTAAVFESPPVHNIETMTPEEVKELRLRPMEIGAEEAAKREADILVFAEYGANPSTVREVIQNYGELIPDPQKIKFNPCDEGSSEQMTTLSRFSCMAKKHNMYVVGGLVHTQPCTKETETCDAKNIQECSSSPKCPKDGHFLYNTAAAFDRKGNLIGRYHKNHLYFEMLDTPEKPEMITFETEFGMLGIFVCFDSIFRDALDLVKNHSVETVIFPSHWYDDIIPLHAVEWQQSWAIANRVNIITANKHCPGSGTLGSGIYSKDLGALTYTYNPDGKYKLLVSKVPRHSHEHGSILDKKPKVLVIEEDKIVEVEETGDSFPDLYLVDVAGPPKNFDRDYRCYKRQVAHHALKKLEHTKGKIESCHNNFCCSLKYEASSMEEDYYLTAYNGENNVRGYFKWREEACLLVRCDPFGNENCVSFPPKAKTVFKNLELKAKFRSQSVYPAVSKSHRRLAPKSEWTYSKQDEYVTLKFNSKSNDPLLKAALYGRNYAKDPPFIPFHKS